MYEDINFDTIMEAMLNRVPDTVDKREGSIIYDALSPAAAQLTNMYTELSIIMNETFADTASTQYLIKRCAERGITMKQATPSIVKAICLPATVDILNKRFNYDAINFTVTEKISDGVYQLQCETSGEMGNIREGTLFPIDYLEGLESLSITELLVPGEDMEDTEALRTRYFDSFSSQSFGGNVADYKEKVMRMDGIGGVKVYPTWNGGGTVKLVIQNSSFGVPSSELINLVKEKMDPEVNSGKGMGLAPIGHQVTILGVSVVMIHLTSTYTFSKNYVWEDVKENVETAVDNYLQELNENWSDFENIIVRISQLESRILTVEGILDVSNTKINDAAANYSIGANEIVVRGEISHE